MMSDKRKQEAVSGGAPSEGSTQDGNMSSPINPTQASTGPAPVDRAAASKAAALAAGQDAQAVQGNAPLEAPVSVDATPSSPPPEGLANTAKAAVACAALAAAGQEVRFLSDESGGGASAQLVDREGT